MFDPPREVVIIWDLRTRLEQVLGLLRSGRGNETRAALALDSTVRAVDAELESRGYRKAAAGPTDDAFGSPLGKLPLAEVSSYTLVQPADGASNR